jgi:hypothetical protein
MARPGGAPTVRRTSRRARSTAYADPGAHRSSSTVTASRAASPVTRPAGQAAGTAGSRSSRPCAERSSIAATTAGSPPAMSTLKIASRLWVGTRFGRQYRCAIVSTVVHASSARPSAAAASPSWTSPYAISSASAPAHHASRLRMVATAAARTAGSPVISGSASYQSGHRCEACRWAGWSARPGWHHSASRPSAIR